MPSPTKDVISQCLAPLINATPAMGFVCVAGSAAEKVTFVGGAGQVAGIYDLASLTKPYTSTVLGLAQLRGQVKLEDVIQNHFPEDWPRLPEQLSKVTILQLANHTSGLPRLPVNLRTGGPAGAEGPYAQYNPNLLKEALQQTQLDFEPGSRASYSNFGYGILGQLLEWRMNQRFETLISTEICNPLGLRETVITLPQHLTNRAVQGYDNSGNPVGRWRNPTLPGAGCILSSAHDLSTFLASNVDPPRTELGRAITLTHVPTARLTAAMEVGLAWHIVRHKHGNEYIWHNGGSGGFGSFGGFSKEARVSLTLLYNSPHRPEVDAAALRTLHILASKAPNGECLR